MRDRDGRPLTEEGSWPEELATRPSWRRAATWRPRAGSIVDPRRQSLGAWGEGVGDTVVTSASIDTHHEFLQSPIHISDILYMNAALAVQTERIRAMTADEKVRVAHALWIQAREVLASGVRARNPQLSTTQVAERVRELMRDAGT